VGFQAVQVVGHFNVHLVADLGGTVEGQGILGPCLPSGGSRHCDQFLTFCGNETLCVVQSFEPQDWLKDARNWATWYHQGTPSRPHLKDFVLVLVVDHRAGHVRSYRPSLSASCLNSDYCLVLCRFGQDVGRRRTTAATNDAWGKPEGPAKYRVYSE
jgi:hypothetical protein